MTDLLTASPPRARNGRPRHRGDRDAAPAAQPADAQAGGEAERGLLRAAIGWAAHGVFFMLLVGAALIRFGQVFDIFAAIVAIICAASFRTAWLRLREHRAVAQRRAAIAAEAER